MFLTVCANPSVDSFWSVNQLRKGTTNRSQKESFYPGGKGIHTAMALNELGQKVKTLGVWGGQTGHWLKEECNSKGIETIGPSVEHWSRISITFRSDSDWSDTELRGNGPEASEAEASDFEDTYSHFLENNQVEAVLISGSAPAGFDDSLYARMIEKAKEIETPVFVDASGALLEKSLDARPRCIHINQDEGHELTGKKNPVEIAQWLGNHCTLAAVTAGADGLYLHYQNKVYHASHALEKDEIHSTIGAGDCLLAGLCFATLNDNDPSYWAKFAVACGSANCVNPKLGMIREDDVYHMVDQVKSGMF